MVSHATAGVDTSCLQHSYDLDLDDEAYLLAAAHLQLGQLLEKQGELQEAQSHLSTSLQIFPTYIAALTALAQVRVAMFASCLSSREAVGAPGVWPTGA